MQATSYRPSGYRAHASPARRGVSMALSLGIAALILLALMRLGGITSRDFGDGRRLSTFDVTTRASGAAQEASRDRAVTTPRQATRATERPTPQRPPVAPPAPTPPLYLPGVMILNSADYAASNIGRIRGTASAAQGSAQVASTGAGDDTPSAGQGPGGQKLYEAEWYRRPRRAETEPYMPAGKVGWGMVACRTIDRYHVEDCVELGETPGSGIARGLRQAAWQFLVRPPRINGKSQIGAWVRIRFTLTAGPESGGGDGGDADGG